MAKVRVHVGPPMLVVSSSIRDQLKAKPWGQTEKASVVLCHLPTNAVSLIMSSSEHVLFPNRSPLPF